MNTLVAFDKFKDALTAREVCQTARKAIESIHPDWKINTAPLADGGDGFCDTLTGAIDGEFHTRTVSSPIGKSVDSLFGIVSYESIHPDAQSILNFRSKPKKVAIIEMAQSSGIALLSHEERTPWSTSTVGLGELMKAAIEEGAEAAVIGLGGSATHDLGLGALQILGFEFKDAAGNIAHALPCPETWAGISSIDKAQQPFKEGFQIAIACDVENPLLGPEGSAAIFGPQKGLMEADYEELESLTRKMATLLCEACGADPAKAMQSPGSGAAGGTALGLEVGLEGHIIPGFDLVKAWIGLEPKLSDADLVITGEGRFDQTSFQGKGPGSLAKEALKLGKKVQVFAGSTEESIRDFSENLSVEAISPKEMPLSEALENTKRLLTESILRRLA